MTLQDFLDLITLDTFDYGTGDSPYYDYEAKEEMQYYYDY
jgi:hypothetical protein